MENLLKNKILEVYKKHGEIKTTCCRQCTCCRVACPQMKYSEALTIVDHIWKNYDDVARKKILTKSVKYFFSKSLIKPCLFLNGNECEIYEIRPLNCRLYGLWSKKSWDERVVKMASYLKLPIEKIPLNTQCKFVRPKSGLKLEEKQIADLFESLDSIDKAILSSGSGQYVSQKANEMINKNWNYRTIHDWILFFFWGEEKLYQMTEVAMIATDDQLEDILSSFVDMVNSKDFSTKEALV